MSPEQVVRAVQHVVVAISVVALVVAAGFTLYRLSKGPTNLDRIIASDLMLGIAVGGFALHIVLSEETTALPVVLAISLVGFIGAISMARFVHDRQPSSPPDVRRSRRRGDTGRQTVRGERPVVAPAGEPRAGRPAPEPMAGGTDRGGEA
ncbi:multicomponent Na+:H+ antiporter subunit F [Raineyella antarctica]|uniref:Multicomponent Na+:H+ antiporter subunit F n=1 Tax=Raineyella antarctica TaxID=1577474 RepID=A0A1G6H3W4_9ACTN|nr:monovalent cation/H+ antiporter complex subunit F [Raineyella antarctica]SDB88106.1 multicomponent Na+:H+ antiporter subunit F [Raineyella antarctica]